MPSIKDLKKRIATVKNTQQTTRAMKMVSAAKLRRAQEAIQNQRPYAKRVGALMHRLAKDPRFPQDSMRSTPTQEGQTQNAKKKLLLVLVTSDRGLCGGFNGNIIKGCQKWLAAHTDPSVDVSLAFVGRKGYEFFKTKKVPILTNFADCGGKVNFAKAKKLSSSLVDYYVNGEVDEVKIIFNEFKNAVSQETRVEDFLPLGVESESARTEGATDGAQGDLSNYLIKPGIRELAHELRLKHFAIQAYRILLESQAGEHGARMSAMENATKNAGEMILKLTLQYNKQRQSGITKELLEIISGSESQKASA